MKDFIEIKLTENEVELLIKLIQGSDYYYEPDVYMHILKILQEELDKRGYYE